MGWSVRLPISGNPNRRRGQGGVDPVQLAGQHTVQRYHQWGLGYIFLIFNVYCPSINILNWTERYFVEFYPSNHIIFFNLSWIISNLSPSTRKQIFIMIFWGEIGSLVNFFFFTWFPLAGPLDISALDLIPPPKKDKLVKLVTSSQEI